MGKIFHYWEGLNLFPCVNSCLSIPNCLGTVMAMLGKGPNHEFYAKI